MTCSLISCSESKNDYSDNVSDYNSHYTTNEVNEDIVITMAIMVPEEDEERYQKIANSFNESNVGVTVQLKNYIDYYVGSKEGGYHRDGYKPADFQLTQDIMNGNDIDIISNASFGDSSKYEILKSKGAFVDLYSFMQNDDEINLETLNNHILTLNEINGKLYSLPTRYGVKTLCGKRKFVGEKQNWTIDEFISHWKDMPPNSTINGSRKSEYVYYTIIRENLSNFVDYKNFTVNFDCDDFRNLLTFCNSFEYNNQQKDFTSDSSVFVNDCLIYGFANAAEYFSNEKNITVVGFPTSNRNGAYFHTLGSVYSINANSSKDKIEAAWKFIRSFVTVDALMDNYISRHEFTENGKKYVQYDDEPGFPINNKAFDMQKTDILSGKYLSTGIDLNGEEYVEKPPKSEDVELLLNYMDSIQRWEVINNHGLEKIVEEEVFEYLADEITLDICIERIQNRASIWISEQK